MKKAVFEIDNKNMLESLLASGLIGFAASGFFSYLSGHAELSPGLV